MDIRLIKALERHPRISYSELSDQLGISAPSVQRRLADLERTGRIKGYAANINPQLLGGTMTVLWGHAKKPLSPEASKALEEQGSVRRVIYGCHSYMYMIVVHRSSAELDGVLAILEEKCGVSSPQVLMVGEHYYVDPKPQNLFSSRFKPLEPNGMKGMDYQIIDSLSHDARKPISEVAEELEVSPKMVRRRLANLIGSRMLDFEVLNFPHFSRDIMFMVLVHLRSREHRQAFVDRIMGWDEELLDEIATFDNSWRLVFMDGLATSVDELDSIVNRISTMEEVEGVSGEIVLNVHFFQTWVEREVRKRALQARRGN